MRPSCEGHPEPDLWFSSSSKSLARARDVCSSCPVRRRCQQLAQQNGEEWGVWGGVDFNHTSLKVAA